MAVANHCDDDAKLSYEVSLYVPDELEEKKEEDEKDSILSDDQMNIELSKKQFDTPSQTAGGKRELVIKGTASFGHIGEQLSPS